VKDKNYNTIAELDGDDPERNKSNAHLISAAPDLLEACKQLLDDMRHSADRGEKVHITAIEGHAHNLLKNAVLKAEGRVKA